MLIVLSDLHFAEAETSHLGRLSVNHNLPSIVYKAFFREIAEFIRDDNVKTVDIVLAGDIFEINRSGFWLVDSLRPYVNNSQVEADPALERRVLEILDAIAREPRVSETLLLFRQLPELFKRPVRVHYIPGNHDRLTNASPKIRRRIQSFLGLELSDEKFNPQYVHYVHGDALILVRHGHEYDPSNFSLNLRKSASIPALIDPEAYEKPVVGDIITVEIASKIPKLFKEYYSEETILSIDELVLIYRRLNDFDNVRPPEAILNFLFSTPGLTQKEVWRFIEPVFMKALDDIALDGNIGRSLIQWGGIVGFAAFMTRLLLKSRFWKRGIPFWLIKILLTPASRKSGEDIDIKIVQKEEVVQDPGSSIRCVVSGHTHTAKVALLDVRDGKEIYYLNSGTFRNVISATPDLSEFGRTRSKARVLIFEPGERNPDYVRKTGWSFDVVAKYSFGSELTESPDQELANEDLQ